MRKLAFGIVLFLAITLILSQPALALQFGRPDGDITAGAWEDTTGGDSDGALWDEIDEASADDGTTYVRAASTSTMEVSLGDVTDPLSSSGHIIRFRAFATGSGGPERIRQQLYEGATFIADAGNQAITRGSWNTYTYTLAGAEADAINGQAGYNDLRFRFSATVNSETVDLTWAEFEVPDTAGWTNTAPSIDQSFSSQEGGHNISYEEAFTATDPDTNQTLVWTLASNLSSLGVEWDNRSAWVNGTPTFPERDQSYYVNVTVGDEATTGNLTDSLNYTLYINNTLPGSILNPITDDTVTNNTAYSRNLDGGPDANADTHNWTVSTNASFVLAVNVWGVISGTPDAIGQFWVNVTFGDYSGESDFVNYTLIAVEALQVGLSAADLSLIGLATWLVIAVLGFAFKNGWLVLLSGIVGAVFGAWLIDSLSAGFFPIVPVFMVSAFLIVIGAFTLWEEMHG